MENLTSEVQTEEDAGEDKTSDEGFQIKKTVGVFQGVIVLTGIIIGSGIFISPNGVFKAASGSVGVSLLVWLAGGLVACLSGLCYSELASSIPESGGDFVYFNFAYAPWVGFLVPWMYTFVPYGFSLNTLLFSEYAWKAAVGTNCEIPELSVKLTALGYTYLLTFFNCASTKLSLRIQTVFTLSKFVAMLAVVVGAVVFLFAEGENVARENFANAFNKDALDEITFIKLSSSFYQVMWSYAGWQSITYIIEEMKDVKRDLIKVIFLSLGIVMSAYFLINVAYLCVLSPREMMFSPTVASTFADKVYGKAYWFLPLVVCLSLAGSNNGSILTFGKGTYLASRRGALPQIFGMYHIHNNTPTTAFILNAVVVTVIVFLGDLNTLINVYGFMNWTFYGMSAAAVLVLRKRRPDLKRPIKIYTFVPVLVVLLSVFFVVVQFVLNPNFLYFYTIAFFVIGVVLFQVFVQRKIIRLDLTSFTTFLQKFFQVAPVTWNKVK